MSSKRKKAPAVNSIDALAELSRKVMQTGKADGRKSDRPALPGRTEIPIDGGKYQVAVHVPFDEKANAYTFANGLPLVTGLLISAGPMNDVRPRMRTLYVQIEHAGPVLDASILKAANEAANALRSFYRNPANAAAIASVPKTNA